MEFFKAKKKKNKSPAYSPKKKIDPFKALEEENKKKAAEEKKINLDEALEFFKGQSTWDKTDKIVQGYKDLKKLFTEEKEHVERLQSSLKEA